MFNNLFYLNRVGMLGNSGLQAKSCELVLFHNIRLSRQGRNSRQVGILPDQHSIGWTLSDYNIQKRSTLDLYLGEK
jgi:hypothetical protein